jgi:AAA domain, putative AbiEii toxin, Type IV TA system
MSHRRANGHCLTFTSIHVENWRNFSSASADLAQRVFLVGPNASGKSNFLDVFRFLHDVVSVGGGLEEACRRRQGISRVRALTARRFPNVRIVVTLTGPTGDKWTYDLALGGNKRPEVASEIVELNGTRLLERPNDEDNEDLERLTQTYLQQVNVNKEFRPVVETFAAVRYLHIVPQLIRDPDRSVGRVDDPFGGDLLEQIARTTERTLRSRLSKISNALKVAVPQLSELELWRDGRGAPHLRGRYEHWRPQGAWQTEDQFSDGTLRLLGLLWAMVEDGGLLLLEEPELSLHPDVVRHLPAMFARMQRQSGRQIITSTHSTDLLRDEGVGLDEVLLLTPGDEGTTVRSASTIEDAKALLDGGSTLAEVIMPLTRPTNAEQLMFSFGGN